MKNVDFTLYLVTDSTGLNDNIFLETIEEALLGGVTFLQLREKERTTMDFYLLAKKVKVLADKYKVTFVINDRLDIAMAVDADGVHLGKSDLPIKEAKKIMANPKKIIGATAKTVEDALKAKEEGASYLGVGAIYPTTTKEPAIITQVSTLKDIVKSVSIPTIAIGGLNESNLDILHDTGIDGIAVVSSIMKSPHPKITAENIIKKLLDIIK